MEQGSAEAGIAILADELQSDDSLVTVNPKQRGHERLLLDGTLDEVNDLLR